MYDLKSNLLFTYCIDNTKDLDLFV